MRTWLRGKFTLLFITCAVVLAIPAIALADNAVADGDGVTPLTDNPTMAFGNVGCNVAATNKALIAISRNGSGTNVFANGASVTVTAAATGNAALSAAMDSSTITLPSNWGSLANNTLSNNVSSTVTVNSSAPGAGSGTVTFTATGKNTAGNTINRTDTVNVTWTTGSCDTTAPSVSSIAVADANPTNTTDPLDWTVTFSESVTGVDASDFALATTGLGGSPAITNVSGSGDTYTVTASSGSGSGTLGLNLTDNDSIKDAANNPLGGTDPGNGDFTGDVYVIDRAAPTMTGSAVKGPDFTAAYTAGDWTNKDVRVTFTCADTGGSGLPGTSGNDVQNFTTETDASGVTATTSGTTCVDNAGNTAAAANFGPIKIDRTNPTITGSRTPPANSFGWNNADVEVSFDCADELSDIATCLGNTPLTDETTTSGQSVTGTATDNAGNTASDTVSGIKIDKTNPNVNVTGVSNGATYPLGTVPTAGCSTTDDLSDVNQNATLQPLSGGPVGSVTATCSGASDKAGNSGSASVTYNVEYVWSGFFQPIDNKDPNTGNYILNKAKAGSVVPVKFSLGGDQGLNVLFSGYPQTASIPCTASSSDVVEEYGTGNVSSFKYDPVANQYIYNWKTDTKWSGTCRQLVVKLADNTYHRANFNFFK
jgi:hypothetical protein